MVLTGSPRPTFAETNAWLLEEQKLLSPVKKGGVSGGGSDDVEMTDAVDDEGDDTLLQDYTQDSSNKLSSTTNSNMNDLGGSPTKMGGSVLFHYKERKYSEGDTSGGKSGTAATSATAAAAAVGVSVNAQVNKNEVFKTNNDAAESNNNNDTTTSTNTPTTATATHTHTTSTTTTDTTTTTSSCSITPQLLSYNGHAYE